MSDIPSLEALVSRHRELHSRGQSVTIEELCADCPELISAVRARLGPSASQAPVPGTINRPVGTSAAASAQEVPATLNLPGSSASGVVPQTLAGAEPDQASAAAFAPAGRPRGALPRVPGYEILSELGRGGMGVVYKALDLKLNRIVALKMILAGAHAGPTELARFHIEAEAVASLQHPNIIQVYQVAEHDNCPFLALEYVNGGSLDELLGGKPQPPLAAAELVEVLARAMSAAHQRGIIHRDLKPGNVLVAHSLAASGPAPGDRAARQGEVAWPTAGRQPLTVKITDFGLAKRLEGEGESHTYSGSVLGTPGYMAPEQALGQPREVGPHSDVYSLGAILYEALAGVPPFRARTVAETISLSTTEEARPPSQAGAGPLPRDLETICLKCLQKDPKKRYPTAGELADDLRRFLDGEPIHARPVGRLERTLKWVRRRPATAALIGVCVLAVVSLLSLGFWYNARLRAARDRAERRSQIAQAAVNDMYTQVAEKWLGDEPQMDDLQRQFLLKAAALYEELADDDEQNPALRRETGQALVRVGQIYRKLNQVADADKAFARAIAIQDELLQKSPASPQYRQDLANSYNWRGELFRTDKHFPEALTSYGRALDLQQALVEQFADEPSYKQELARSYYNRALALAETDRKREARATFRQAIGLLEGVVKLRPRDPGPRQELARVHLNLGTVLRRLGQIDEARKTYEEALRRLGRLRQEHPRKREYRLEQAVALNNLGNLRRENLHDPARAEQDHSTARELLDVLRKEFPARPAYRTELANVCNNLGADLFLQGEKLTPLAGFRGLPGKGIAAARAGQCQAEAAAAWRQAQGLYEDLVRQWPEAPSYRHGAAQARYNLGWLALQKDQPAEARQQLQAAISHEEQALRHTPTSKPYRQWLCRENKSLGRALLALNDHVGAAAAAAEVVRYSDAPDRDGYLAASLLARCAASAGRDPALGERDKQQARQRYGAEAIALLHRLDPRKLPRVKALDREAVFAPLRNLPDFKQEVRRWQTARSSSSPSP
jgi:serine/threonine protein kinase